MLLLPSSEVLEGLVPSLMWICSADLFWLSLWSDMLQRLTADPVKSYRWDRVNEHHKMQRFFKRMIQKFSFSFPQKAFRINQFSNSVIPKQFLEPKLMNSVGPSHSSVAPRLLGFHKVLNSVTPICNSRSDRESHVQWPKPNRWNRFLQLGRSEMSSAET